MTPHPDSTALAHLRRLTGRPDAAFREGQLDAIGVIAVDRGRALVVQRTGWGKSAVYFIATRMLRDAGGGPTLLVSPLLALMRDQLAAAERLGLRAATVNSTNLDDWEAITGRLDAGEVDLLLISPERLANPTFRHEMMPALPDRIGMLVIDEAHCISDWGHDFRPDYRRIRDLIAALPERVPVLATTATANDRVVDDVAEQLHTDPVTLRGTLDRDSLHLHVVDLPTVAAQHAWVAGYLATHEGPGIIYAHTTAATESAARWLADQGHAVAAYHGKLETEVREALEADLKDGRVTALVATTALGMGYDHPTLRFVIHLGAPPSPVAYYQAIGRAGRAVDHADVVLLPQHTDEHIWSWMVDTALPPEPQVRRVLDVLASAPGPVSTQALEQHVNLPRTRIDLLLRVLDVDGAVERVRGGWEATGRPWSYDEERARRLRAAHDAEQQAMRDYLALEDCRMAFLREQLDDPDASACGRCDNCAGGGPEVAVDRAVADAAMQALRGADVRLPPRRRWPSAVGVKGTIAGGALGEGRALGRVGDGAWDGLLLPLVDAATLEDTSLDEVVSGVTDVLARWDWPRRPTLVTWLDDGSALAGALAERIASLGRLPLAPLLTAEPAGEAPANSTRQAESALARVRLVGRPPQGAVVLLVTARVDTGWTVAAAAHRLADAGADLVLPFAALSVR